MSESTGVLGKLKKCCLDQSLKRKKKEKKKKRERSGRNHEGRTSMGKRQPLKNWNSGPLAD
jgi:hypothetical protein